MDHISLTSASSDEVVDNVFLSQLVEGDRTSIQVFEIEPGASVPVHDHHHEQIGFVFEGTLTFLTEDKEIEIGPNESFVIPGGESHGVVNQGEATVFGVDIFSPPRRNPSFSD